MIQKEIWKIQKISIVPDIDMPKFQTIGIDPGTTNLGICVLWDKLNLINLYQVKIVRDKNPIRRIINFQDIMSECVSAFETGTKVIIEGASFGDNYRQVELAGCRTSIALWCLHRGFEVNLLAPSSVRKKVFGSAKIKAHDLWNNIPQDCAAALSCALAVSL